MGLRQFEDSDLLGVQALIHRTVDECYAADYPPRAVAFFKQFHSLDSIRDRVERGHVLVVQRAGSIVATGAVVDGEVTGVFVDSRLQGEGLGTAVMDELERLSRSDGHAIVRLSVSLPSRGFYEHRGYRVMEECAIDVGERQALRYWEAEKALPGAQQRHRADGAR